MDIAFSYKKLAAMLELNQEKNLVYGTYQDVLLAIYPNPERFPVTIQLPYSVKSVPLLKEYIFDITNCHKIASAIEEERILLYAPENLEVVCDVITDTVRLINSFSLKPGCARCGNEAPELYISDGEYGYLCTDCALEYCRELAIYLETEERKSDIPAGMVGAFLGALIGAAVAAFFIWIDGFTVFLSVAIAFCCLRGYQKMGGKFTPLGILLATGLAFFAVYVMNRLDMAYAFYQYSKDFSDYSLFDWYRAVPGMMSQISELHRDYLITLAEMGVLVLLSAAYFAVPDLRNNKKKNGKLRKIG